MAPDDLSPGGSEKECEEGQEVVNWMQPMSISLNFKEIEGSQHRDKVTRVVWEAGGPPLFLP